MRKTTNVLQIIILILLSGGVFQMARGHKDYGDGGQTRIIHSVSDLGEWSRIKQKIVELRFGINRFWVNL